MKFIDCSASIGYATVNKKIINHEKYPIVEKVVQAKDGAELLTFMDKCGIDEAIVYHQQQVDSSVAFGNRLLLSDERNYTGRLKGVLAIAPSITDEGFDVESLFKTLKKYDIFGVRVNPVQNRFMLDRITMGDIFDAITEANVPLYLSPENGWDIVFNALKEFPKLTAIITNYGLWGSDRFIFPLVNAYKNVYVDSSDFQEIKGIETFVNKFGSERMLFGTNFPSDAMGGPRATLIGADVSVEAKENIAHKNIERLIAERKLGGVK